MLLRLFVATCATTSRFFRFLLSVALLVVVLPKSRDGRCPHNRRSGWQYRRLLGALHRAPGCRRADRYRWNVFLRLHPGTWHCAARPHLRQIECSARLSCSLATRFSGLTCHQRSRHSNAVELLSYAGSSVDRPQRRARHRNDLSLRPRTLWHVSAVSVRVRPQA